MKLSSLALNWHYNAGHRLTIYNDSLMVVKQLHGEYTAKKDGADSLSHKSRAATCPIRRVKIVYVRKVVNTRADCLAILIAYLLVLDGEVRHNNI